MLKKHYYKAKGRNLDPIHDLKKLLPIAKKSKKYCWLAEYDSMALQESLRHLKKAFDGFFAGRTGFPHFKTRRGEQLCSVNKNSPLSPAKRTTRVGIFDVTQNERGRDPWVDLPWGGAKPLPKQF